MNRGAYTAFPSHRKRNDPRSPPYPNVSEGRESIPPLRPSQSGPRELEYHCNSEGKVKTRPYKPSQFNPAGIDPSQRSPHWPACFRSAVGAQRLEVNPVFLEPRTKGVWVETQNLGGATGPGDLSFAGPDDRGEVFALDKFERLQLLAR